MRVEQKFLFILTSVCFLVATLIANTPVIAEEDLAQCASKKVRFDGVEPLAYSDIVGESGAHIALSYQYPKLCNSQYGQECQGRAYLIPGDTVAVAKSCGDSSYVQFMGQKKITIGWVSKIHLKNRVAKLPYDDGAPPGYNHFFTPSAATMTLTKGQGRPVCEAYLQRLNQTVYYEPPYCGRPENDQVPGFVRLHRIILDPDEVSKLYGQVGAFLLRSNSTPPQVQNAQEMEEVSRAAGSHKILVWRYEPRVDVENDGTTTNLIVWTGSPISSTGKACGDPHFPNGDPAIKPSVLRWVFSNTGMTFILTPFLTATAGLTSMASAQGWHRFAITSEFFFINGGLRNKCASTCLM